MTRKILPLLALCAAPLLLNACSSKKDTFADGMTAWLKAHPKGLRYCTTVNAPSLAGGFLAFSNGFYLPSPIFDDASKHPILAVEKEGTPDSPVLDALVKAGLASTANLTHVDYTSKYERIPGKFSGHIVYQYKKVTRKVYVAISADNWQVSSVNFNIDQMPASNTQQPQSKSISASVVPISTNGMAPAFCGGTLKVKEVTEYTEPASAFGHVISTATATLTLSDLPKWLSDPAIRAALGTRPKAEYPAKADFVKTSNGWKLDGGIRANGLYGGGL